MTTPDVLVVDDDVLNREVLSRFLRKKNYGVDVAASGSEALEKIGRRPFDLVLLDIMMPGISGIEVLKTLRRSHSPADLPVIMVSAKTDGQDVAEALNLGANDYITKPVDFKVTDARINVQLARKSAERALRDSEHRYALAACGASEGIWDWDLIVGTVYYSPAWKTLLGYAGEQEFTDHPDEWLGRVHPDDHERVLSEIAAHREGRTMEFRSEYRMRHKDGRYRWILGRATVTRTADGVAARMTGTHSDITHGKVSDALTGLANRILFTEAVNEAIERSRRDSDHSFALIFLDLDRFKLINDSFGRLIGDELLVGVAQRLKSRLRSGDTVARVHGDCTIARLDGDEFAILLQDVTRVADVAGVAARIQSAVAAPFHIQGREMFTNVSIGIAMSAPEYATAEDILRDADTAMYRAKALGKGRYEVFDTEMRTRVLARLELETGLRKALENGELAVYYQPKVQLATSRIREFEALVRWRHPSGSLISPVEFIPVAEETGLIVPIGDWVLHEACRQTQAWNRRRPDQNSLAVSVNVSYRQFLEADFVQRVAHALLETGLSPGNLRLEITETVLMQDVSSALRILSELKALGIGLKIDDFGTGYSSLSYLHRFPFDALKIDRSFITRMNTHDGEKMVDAIIQLARSLHMDVVAEGVETREQLQQLVSLGCQFGQGYYFSKPVDAATAEALLSNG